MNRPFPNRAFLLVFLVLPWLSGCLQSSRDVVVGPKALPSPATAPLPDRRLEAKIANLEALLEGKALAAEDRELASNLLAAYETLRSAPRDASGTYDYPRITRLLFENLSRLEERYFSEQRGATAPPAAGDFHAFALKRNKIVEDYLYGDYQSVINGCLEVESSFGAEALTPDLSTVLALSLAEKGLVDEALSIAEVLVHRMKGRPGLLALETRIIQWQIDQGKREKALKAYDRVSEELDDIQARLERLQTSLAQEGLPPSTPSPPSFPGPAAAETTPGTAESIEEILAQADALAARQEFQKAKLLLIRHRLRAEAGPEAEQIDQALRKIESLQGPSREGGTTPEAPREREALTLARRLIQDEKYEEALTRLEEIEGPGAVDAEVEELKTLALERLVHRERNKAAEYFLLARNTQDPQKKKELLLSSYKKLKVLVDKYPTSSLVEKINDHIRKVREALAELGVQPE